jgi:hypothetical protein
MGHSMINRAADQLGFAPREQTEIVVARLLEVSSAFARWQSLNARYKELAEVCHATKSELGEVYTPARVRTHRLLHEAEAAKREYEALEASFRTLAVDCDFNHALPADLFERLVEPTAPPLGRLHRRDRQ